MRKKQLPKQQDLLEETESESKLDPKPDPTETQWINLQQKNLQIDYFG